MVVMAEAVMRQSDEQIVDAVCGGDTEAFRFLVGRHQDTVYGMLLRLVSDSECARDLAQETFVRAYRSLGGFRGDSRFSTWLVQIAIHAARDHQRSKGRSKVISLSELEERRNPEAAIRETRSAFDPMLQLEERELSQRLQEGLKRLPEGYREVFVMRHMEEMSYEDISTLTGNSVGSLKVRSHRARKLLREYLRDDPKPGSRSVSSS